MWKRRWQRNWSSQRAPSLFVRDRLNEWANKMRMAGRHSDDPRIKNKYSSLTFHPLKNGWSRIEPTNHYLVPIPGLSFDRTADTCGEQEIKMVLSRLRPTSYSSSNPWQIRSWWAWMKYFGTFWGRMVLCLGHRVLFPFIKKSVRPRIFSGEFLDWNCKCLADSQTGNRSSLPPYGYTISRACPKGIALAENVEDFENWAFLEHFSDVKVYDVRCAPISRLCAVVNFWAQVDSMRFWTKNIFTGFDLFKLDGCGNQHQCTGSSTGIQEN